MKHRGRDTAGEGASVDAVSAQEERHSDGAGTPVVAIGASAGGLEALREFFTAMPADSGMAFVVVQHLDPSYESRTAEILGKAYRDAGRRGRGRHAR